MRAERTLILVRAAHAVTAEPSVARARERANRVRARRIRVAVVQIQ